MIHAASQDGFSFNCGQARFLLPVLLLLLSGCVLPGLSSSANSDGLLSLLAGYQSSTTVPAVRVSGATAIFTSESGTVQTFGLSLTTKPTAPVTIPVSTSNSLEGEVSTDGVAYGSSLSVIIDPSTYNTPVTVYVRGVDDLASDGNVAYTIVLAATNSADSTYNNIDPQDLSAVNFDNEAVAGQVGIAVGPISGLTTTESGQQASFALVLQSQPAANVTIGIASSNPTEGTVSAASLIFTPLNWGTPQIVTVTGQDDPEADGNVGYTVLTAAAVSADPAYNGINPPDVTVTNLDNDTAGVTIAPASGLIVNESGTSANFNVTLNSRPQAGQQVQIDFASTNILEGTVLPASAVFTTANWNIPQIIVLTGVDDLVTDGNKTYSITSTINGPGTTDTVYSALGPFPAISATTVDNETAGITVSGISGPTTEAGVSATFSIQLNSDPVAGVTIPLLSSDASEGSVSPASVAFTGGACPGPGNWCTAQTITVTGVDDFVQDGSIAYSIVPQPSVSANPLYNGLAGSSVAVTNNDNDAAGISVFDPGAVGLSISEGGLTDTFQLMLNTAPNPGATVRIPLSITAGRQQISLDNATWFTSLNADFTTANWFLPKTVYVRSVQNTTIDHAIGAAQPTFTVTLGATTIPSGADANYLGINPADLTGTNLDDEKYLFITTTTHNGNFDGDATVAGAPYNAINGDGYGLDEADNYCMQGAHGYPGVGTYRAFLSTSDYLGDNRVASLTPNVGDGQRHWILAPLTKYFRADGLSPMTTNAASIFTAWPLGNPFSAGVDSYWTGLWQDWTFGFSCVMWTSQAGGDSGTMGDGTLTTTAAIKAAAVGCNASQKVMCIEQ